ncbi:MAG: hypothetical protein WAZ19_04030 [Anaerolineae bacterium]
MSYYDPTLPVPPNPQQPPRRDRTRLWALVTFLTLSVLSVLAAMLIVSGGQLPTLNEDVSWTPPASPTVAAMADAQQAAVGQSNFAAGAAVVNTSSGPVNLRRSAGYQNKPGSDVLAVIGAGERGTITGGPEAVDGLIWWQVRFATAEGWMAERSASGVTLLGIAP